MYVYVWAFINTHTHTHTHKTLLIFVIQECLADAHPAYTRNWNKGTASNTKESGFLHLSQGDMGIQII